MPASDVSREAVELAVREVIGIVLPALPGGAIETNKHLSDLGADSVDRVEIVLMLLDRLHLDEPMSSFNRLPDVGALVTFLTERCGRV
jgi:polyketide biosynthesis acyl carrier protein